MSDDTPLTYLVLIEADDGDTLVDGPYPRDRVADAAAAIAQKRADDSDRVATQQGDGLAEWLVHRADDPHGDIGDATTLYVIATCPTVHFD